jgi:DNA-binding CsgD family transcriptional regulator
VGRYQEALLDLQAALQTARDQGRLPLAAHISASLAHVCCAAGETGQAHAIAADFLAAAANLAGRLPETPAPLPTSGSASLRTVALAEMMSWLPDSLRPVPESPAAPAAKTKTAQAEISLSRRELEVAELVTQGQTNRAIAERLVISERTAERHVANIMAKLGMSTRAQIAAWGAQRSSTRG